MDHKIHNDILFPPEANVGLLVNDIFKLSSLGLLFVAFFNRNISLTNTFERGKRQLNGKYDILFECLMEHTDIQLKTLRTKLPKILFVFQTFEGS